MKKTLLAMAIAGIIAAPAAQADTANTSVYGKIHYSWDFADYDATNAADTSDRDDDVTAVNRASRVGLKGTEDLGNGLKALYLVELGLGGTAGAATGERLAYAGISGDFGTVLIGDQYRPYKLSTASLDVFADTVGDYNEVISNGHDGYNYETASNAVAYASPKFSGAQVTVARVSALDNEGAGEEESEALSLGVTYGAGPLYVGFGWENQTEDNGAGVADDTDTDAIKIGAGYTMGDMKVGFVWENISEDTNGVETVDRDRYLINGSYTMGANTLMLAYGDMDNNGAVAGSNDGGSVLSLGVSHAMSKRTSAYAIYSGTDNDAGGSVDINNYTSTAAGKDVSAFSFGVVHNF